MKGLEETSASIVDLSDVNLVPILELEEVGMVECTYLERDSEPIACEPIECYQVSPLLGSEEVGFHFSQGHWPLQVSH